MSKKSKLNFTLAGVNMTKVEQKYCLDNTNIHDDGKVPTKSTRVDDLDLLKKQPEIISFLDESKILRKCHVSMIDFTSKNSLDNSDHDYKCFWDKDYLPPETRPIGCPIKFIPAKALKTYYSEISKENYTIAEHITDVRAKKIKSLEDEEIIIENSSRYETDGIFCSLNCCLAFIRAPENKKNPLYRHSETLLLQICTELNPDNEIQIKPAPHWRMLKCFGGKLSIEKFRESFNKVLYTDHGLIFNSIGFLYEDQIKL